MTTRMEARKWLREHKARKMAEISKWLAGHFNDDTKAQAKARAEAVYICGSFFEEEWLEAATFAVKEG